MPAIDIQVLEGVFDADEKKAMIEKVTAAISEVAGKTIASNTSVRIHEIKSGSWGYGGNTLHTSDAIRMKDKG